MSMLVCVHSIYDVLMCTEHNPLFFLAYERVKVDEKRLEPHLWTFRSRVDVNHLRGYLQQQKNKDVKVLSGFLNEVSD